MKKHKSIKTLITARALSAIIVTIPALAISCSNSSDSIPTSIDIWSDVKKIEVSVGEQYRSKVYSKCNPTNKADQRVVWHVYDIDGSVAPNWISVDEQGYINIKNTTTGADIGIHNFQIEAQSIKAPEIKSDALDIEIEITPYDTQLLYVLNSDNQSYSVKAADQNISGVVVIPSTHDLLPVTSIEDSAFRECRNLTSVIIPNSVKTIGASAFEYCYGLSSVTIGSSVTTIGTNAFTYCSNLTSIINYSDAFVFANNVGDAKILLHAVSGGNYDYGKFSGQIVGRGLAFGNLTIPNNVTSIGADAFRNCCGLTSVTIPSSVISIGQYAFSTCYRLSSLTIPNSVTSINSNAFEYCYGLTSITIPNNINFIEDSIFAHCYDLTSITIPESITTMGSNAFAYCTKLTSAEFLGDTPTLGAYIFRSAPTSLKVYVPTKYWSHWNNKSVADSLSVSLNQIEEK